MRLWRIVEKSSSVTEASGYLSCRFPQATNAYVSIGTITNLNLVLSLLHAEAEGKPPAKGNSEVTNFGALWYFSSCDLDVSPRWPTDQDWVTTWSAVQGDGSLAFFYCDFHRFLGLRITDYVLDFLPACYHRYCTQVVLWNLSNLSFLFCLALLPLRQRVSDQE